MLFPATWGGGGSFRLHEVKLLCSAFAYLTESAPPKKAWVLPHTHAHTHAHAHAELLTCLLPTEIQERDERSSTTMESSAQSNLARLNVQTFSGSEGPSTPAQLTWALGNTVHSQHGP